MCLAHHQDLGEIEHVAELHRKIGSALAHKGERKRAIEHHQQGINLIKDLEPSLALVRLYEEAASLYMHVGDNMLAIYASEKALRLAERLGETRAAGRAHGVFGRVFGRIGDIAKARENLERAVRARARLRCERDGARDARARPTPRERRRRLPGRRRRVHGGAGARPTNRRRSRADRVAGRTRAARLLSLRLGRDAAGQRDGCRPRRARRTGRQALPGGHVARVPVAGAKAIGSKSERLFLRAHERAERIGWSEVSFGALLGLSVALRDSDELPRAETVLAQALAVCDRAGLLAQSVQAHSARAHVFTLAGRGQDARAAADDAAMIAERIRYPVAEAAALEARGIAGELPAASERSLKRGPLGDTRPPARCCALRAPARPGHARPQRGWQRRGGPRAPPRPTSSSASPTSPVVRGTWSTLDRSLARAKYPGPLARAARRLACPRPDRSRPFTA